MAILELTTEQVIALVKQLSPESKNLVFSALQSDLQVQDPANDTRSLDPETQAWLEADLGENLPPYDWGLADIPLGQPIRYIAGQGLIVEGGKNLV